MIPSESQAAGPECLPPWAQELRETYLAGATSMFLIHGNVDDLVAVTAANEPPSFVGLAEYVATQLFGAWKVALLYDLSRPLRALPGRDPKRLQQINAHIERFIGPLDKLPHEPTQVLALLDRYLEQAVVNASIGGEQPEVALVLTYAQLLVPASAPGSTTPEVARRLATLLNWAKQPQFKRLNLAFCLIAPERAEVHAALAQSSHIRAVEVSLPSLDERLAFVTAQLPSYGTVSDSSTDGAVRPAEHVPLSPMAIAELTAGLTLVELQGLLSMSAHLGRPLSEVELKHHKKRRIEASCDGMLEIIDPKHTLEFVVGQPHAKARLREDARLVTAGHLEGCPMGYLLSGPVGTGKTFLAECYAGEVGLPCLRLQNFRSKYVGESEANLERLLRLLRVMGPVVVMIDEADAALGNRDQQGDSGTSGRIFAKIAAQMSDTSYRGRIIWFLMTCRPDLLPIDLKRQGRAEVHLALFYPRDEPEMREMFVTMARKQGQKLAPEAVPTMPHPKLSGADIEGVVTRAIRLALLGGRQQISTDDLGQAAATFIPSADTEEKRLQEIASVLECTELDSLPAEWQEQVRTPAGKSALLRRFERLRARVR